MKKIYYLFFLLSSLFLFSQNVGDFKSSGSGNWTNPSIWQVWNGTSWVSSVSYYPTTGRYPGQVAGSYTVTIETGHVITVPAVSNYTIGDLIVKGTLVLNANLTLNNFGSVTSKTLEINLGKISFEQGVEFRLPASTLFLLNIEDTLTQGLHATGSPGSCNNNTAVYIGGVPYTTCKGKGNASSGDTFEDLNNGSAALRSSFNINPTSAMFCKAEPFNFTGSYLWNSPQGLPEPTSVSYTLTLIFAPIAYPVTLAGPTLFPASKTFTSTSYSYSTSGDYLFRFLVTAGKYKGSKDIWISVDKSTTWNGTQWSNGNLDNPTIAGTKYNVIINGNYNTSASGNFGACSCTVNDTGSLTINSGGYVKVQNNITNSGNFVVESDGNLLQVNPNGINSGNILVKRNSNMKRLDYTYWGSPVVDQQLRSFSPLTVASRFYSYNESYDSFSTIPNLNSPFEKGIGYVIRAPNNYTTAVQPFEGRFTGVPHNGDITITLPYTNSTRGRSLISNPYASNLDLSLLTTDNSGVLSGLFYFWTNDAGTFIQNHTATDGIYGEYTGNGYATLNVLGGVSASGPSGNSSKIPSAIIKPGQGFIAQAKAAGGVSFKNTQRTKETVANSQTSIFFNKSGESAKTTTVAGRYWISMTSAFGLKNTLLIGYVSDASKGFENKYDAEIGSNSSDSFYSIVGDKKLVIQGRDSSSSLNDDVVPLGVSHYMGGTNIIKLENKDGIFANGQSIYLKDNETGLVTNLSEKSYTYQNAVTGTNNTRFEIIYSNNVLTAKKSSIEQSIEVYRSGNDFVVKSGTGNINQVEVFDTSGSLVFKTDQSNKEIIIPGNKIRTGLSIIKITKANRVITRKILK